MSEKHCLCENTTESRSLGDIYVKSCKNHKNLKVQKKSESSEEVPKKMSKNIQKKH